VLQLDGLPAGQRIAEVSALTDPVARNRAITGVYHQLAVAVRDWVGGPDASWCAFAVWASGTAGASIRLDEVPGKIDAFLRASDHYGRIQRALGHAIEHSEVLGVVDKTLDDVSGDIAAGNVLVFNELAPAYVSLLDDQSPPPGTPPPVTTALAAYRRAKAAAGPSDRAVRAQNMLLANLVAVLHEQERLQSAIGKALDAGLGETAKAIARDRLAKDAERQLGEHLRGLGHLVDDAWERAMTEHVMTLNVAGEVLHLGRDVPPLPDGRMFPVDLSDLTLADLVKVVGTYDRTHGTGVGSAAHDWRRLADRMNYIVNLFRSRQQYGPLFNAPA
jgi:hypothetical protein